ncbi:MAG: ATP-binding cassette domain-containing protein [Acidobacteria bacterium]|nr:MAG: ATP-binding cassette domain-containing protein [Acidobacteriota bacterium]
MALELRSISKQIGSFSVSDLSLRVEEAEYFVLLGPSGVGKTVILEMIAGLLTPDDGDVYWDGANVTRLPPDRRGFAIVYQDYQLFPHLTVRQNILYGLQARHYSRSEAYERAETTAELLGITPLLDQYPAVLSGGEQQRTALARALVLTPPLLLLDEPLSALDLRIRRQLRQELKQLRRASRATFVHVTHDIEEAFVLGERVAVMLEGRIRQIATPYQLSHTPSDREVADFLELGNVFAVDSCAGEVCRVGDIRFHTGGCIEATRFIWIRPEEIVLSRTSCEGAVRNHFNGRIEDWELRNVLFKVTVSVDGLRLAVLVNHACFSQLNAETGGEVYVSFSPSAVHCF